MLQAAKEVHHPATLFTPEGTFPSTRNVSLPLSPVAVQYFERGPSTLHRFLPFRVAEVVGWFVTLLTPLATAAVFLFKAVPGMIRFRFNVQLQRLYRRLERVEKRSAEVDVETVLDELDAIESASSRLKVPRTQDAPYFEFRQNVHDVRDRVTSDST